MALYMHHLSGRLRVRSPIVKRNDAKAATVRRLLAAMEGVTQVKVRTVTGSITIYYDHETLTAQHLLDRLHEAGFVKELRLDCQEGSSGSAERAAQRLGEAIGRVALGAVVEKLVERSALALIAAIV